MELVIGDLFAISPNKRIPDRSYIDNVWRVKAETKTQIWATCEAGNSWRKSHEAVCFVKNEYDFHRVSESTLRDIHHNPESKEAA